MTEHQEKKKSVEPEPEMEQSMELSGRVTKNNINIFNDTLQKVNSKHAQIKKFSSETEE